ncbi:LytR family transcriptional regulator [Brachybacterium endophyticum]|uniref:LytR family transcriptional regulator n=1 Tax=Brachybacterium endophyticum TaxID=2182385 RepID=A0A2U2RKY7_9MICO|nr:LCP family protein [Brachybacterium endophyticum]PWH06444.1 LytR family transcriptional regulator [Brachybacterium endophyticum]
MSEDLDIFSADETGAAARPPRRRRRVALIALLVVLALVIAAGVVVGRYFYSLDHAYQKHSVVSLDHGPSDDERTGKGQNILLLGSDKRSGEEAEKSGVSGQRSDTMMLVHIPEDGSEAYIVSFPRDLYVPIPGHGKDRINSALAYGGLPLAVNTVEDYTDAPIDHVALIDFDGIQGLVDTLGGVDVTVPETFEQKGVTFTEGEQHVDGKEALIFARERKAFSDGDFQRNRDQQELLKAIAGKLISKDTLSSPTKMKNSVEALSPYLTTDDGLTTRQLVNLGLSNRNLRSSDLHFLAAPHGGPTTGAGGASVVSTDEKAMDGLRDALKNDSMEEYAAENG